MYLHWLYNLSVFISKYQLSLMTASYFFYDSLWEFHVPSWWFTNLCNTSSFVQYTILIQEFHPNYLHKLVDLFSCLLDQSVALVKVCFTILLTRNLSLLHWQQIQHSFNHFKLDADVYSPPNSAGLPSCLPFFHTMELHSIWSSTDSCFQHCSWPLGRVSPDRVPYLSSSRCTPKRLVVRKQIFTKYRPLCFPAKALIRSTTVLDSQHSEKLPWRKIIRMQTSESGSI